ncbi:MAG: hypothetical protein BGN92_05760 [Sphingobacteriales bacterium 41-5]|nr:MAG: hypothetical protein BGN92_05760 [Sphingobacteriales bacterium 41-5]
MKQALFLFFVGFIFSIDVHAQEELPDFSIYKVGGGRVMISWTHNFKDIKQISVQRSHDQNNYFKTIAIVPDPSLMQNGVADTKAPNDSMYYRIFVMQEGGKFFTSKVKQPAVDSLGLAGAYSSVDNSPSTPTTNFLPAGFVQSKYIFTSLDRYVRVELPFDSRKYDIKFFTEYNLPLFELHDLKEKRFKLDRSTFGSAGYVNFELYADGKLLEKYKLYLPKDF